MIDFDPHPNLQDLIAIHDAAQTPLPALTTRGTAAVAARRFMEALNALDPEDRERLLADVVVNVAPGTHGRGFSLLISHAPTRDPQPA